MKVVFSYDCEGNWGCVDWEEPYLSDDYADRLENAYKEIVNLHASYQIKASFGFVGAYIDEPHKRQEKISTFMSDYQDRFPNIMRSGGCWDGRKNFDIVANSTLTHEICSHSYSHVCYDVLDDGQLMHDLRFSVDILNTLGVPEVDSLIFPRNKIVPIDRNLIRFYRNTPANSRYEKYIDFSQNVFGLNLTSAKERSVFMHWNVGVRKKIGDGMWKSSWEKRCEVCRDDVTIHVWSHPHNFVTDPSLIKRLEWLMETLANSKVEIEIRTLSELYREQEIEQS